jgi:hypothetical protein
MYSFYWTANEKGRWLGEYKDTTTGHVDVEAQVAVLELKSPRPDDHALQVDILCRRHGKGKIEQILFASTTQKTFFTDLEELILTKLYTPMELMTHRLPR